MAVTDQVLTKIFAGNRHTLNFVVLDQDAGGSPLPPKDITGLRLLFALSTVDPQSGKFSTNPVLLKDSDVAGDITRPNDAGGVVDVELFGVDTDALGGATYYWELESIDPGGESLVLATGTVPIERNVNESV